LARLSFLAGVNFCQEHSTYIGFLPLSTASDFSGDSTPHGSGWLYYHPTLYEPYTQDLRRLQQNILGMTDL